MAERAICYPPSVEGIYHSVSNMKFDHFGKCRGLPPQAREEFTSLKSSCSRKGTAGNNSSSRGSSSSHTQVAVDGGRVAVSSSQVAVSSNGRQSAVSRQHVVVNGDNGAS